MLLSNVLGRENKMSRKRRASEEYITPTEYADKIGVCLESVYRWIGRNELRAIRVGRCWRLPVAQLDYSPSTTCPDGREFVDG